MGYTTRCSRTDCGGVIIVEPERMCVLSTSKDGTSASYPCNTCYLLHWSSGIAVVDTGRHAYQCRDELVLKSMKSN